VVIWKDPVTAMQRTKALGLLHKTIRKDSAMSRQGIPDYLVTLRKPGKNPDPITHWSTDRNGKEQDRTETNEQLEVDTWQRYASPVWMDIDPNDTLQYRSAREHDDERHICPLQLPVITRALLLWTAPNDIVHTPFAGIGSEMVAALRLGRRAVGAELKLSYFTQAAANCHAASTNAQVDMFAPTPIPTAAQADTEPAPPL
jgi:DNA modification methylase